MRESQIEAYLVKRVKALGGEVRKVKWIGRRGAPDRLVMLPTRMDPPALRCPKTLLAATIWVELKATGVEPEPHQVREHARMRRMGQRVVVIDSLQGVDEVLA